MLPKLTHYIIVNVQFSTKNCETCKEIGKFGPYIGIKQPIEIASEEAQILYVLYKDFNLAIINICKDIMGAVSKELKESIQRMLYHIKNINKELGTIKKNQIEVLELRSTIIEMKNSLGGLDSSLELAEERISELESKSTEIIQFVGQKEKRLKKINRVLANHGTQSNILTYA